MVREAALSREGTVALPDGRATDTRPLTSISWNITIGVIRQRFLNLDDFDDQN